VAVPQSDYVPNDAHHRHRVRVPFDHLPPRVRVDRVAPQLLREEVTGSFGHQLRQHLLQHAQGPLLAIVDVLDPVLLQQRVQLVVEQLGGSQHARGGVHVVLDERLGHLALLPSLVQGENRSCPVHPRDQPRSRSQRDDRVMTRAVQIVTRQVRVLGHHRVGDAQELHDSLVQVQIFQALEQISVGLAVRPVKNQLLRFGLGRQDGHDVGDVRDRHSGLGRRGQARHGDHGVLDRRQNRTNRLHFERVRRPSVELLLELLLQSLQGLQRLLRLVRVLWILQLGDHLSDLVQVLLLEVLLVRSLRFRTSNFLQLFQNENDRFDYDPVLLGYQRHLLFLVQVGVLVDLLDLVLQLLLALRDFGLVLGQSAQPELVPTTA
jgi:hypothetical protein